MGEVKMANTRKQHMVHVVGEGIPAHKMGLYDAVDYLGTTPQGARKIMDGVWEMPGVMIYDDGWENMRRKRPCIRCGQPIDNCRCTVFCDQCREDNIEVGKARKNARYVYHGKTERPKSPLAQIAQEARDHGMTYGQYVGSKAARWFG